LHQFWPARLALPVVHRFDREAGRIGPRDIALQAWRNYRPMCRFANHAARGMAHFNNMHLFQVDVDFDDLIVNRPARDVVGRTIKTASERIVELAFCAGDWAAS